MEQSIKLELSLGEVNGILTALGNMPFVQVADLIARIREQAVPQAQPAQEAAPVAE